jgi:hypothetical protein
VCLGFRLTDLSNIDELLHERLVFRGLSNLLFADNITTTVANLHQIKTVATDRGARECRAHAGAT